MPIFDPISEKQIGRKKRNTIHKKGLWHKGIQVNIVRKNQLGTFDVLVQKRSNKVDISKNKYDQSVAIQMISLDHLDEKLSLKRGLYEELGIRKYDYRKMPLNIRIIKTYADSGHINKEMIVLYTVMLPRRSNVRIRSEKLVELVWFEWNSLLELVRENQDSITKTAQLYFLNKEIKEVIYNETMKCLYPKGKERCAEGHNFGYYFHVSLKNRKYTKKLKNIGDMAKYL